MAMRSARKVYGQTLTELGQKDKRIVALEADLGKSSQSIIFEKAIPERYFELGIAEANMVSFAAGLALAGKIPYLHSFAVFSTGRVYDQIRASLCIANLHAVIVGASCGLSDACDGSTHQCIEDISLMRTLPNTTVLCPADAYEASEMAKAVVDRQGPCYIRLCRSDMPDVLPQDGKYKLGKMIEMEKEGDVAIFATGLMLSHALDAAKLLKREGISVRVINVGCIKPLDTETLFRIAGEVKGILTVEEHSVIGGLGSAVCETLADRPHPPVKRMGVQDKFGCSAFVPDELYEHYGLTPAHIAAAVKELCR